MLSVNGSSDVCYSVLASVRRLAHGFGDDLHYDDVGEVDQAQEADRQAIVVAIADSDGRLLGREVENGEHRAAALVEQRLAATDLQALADHVVARRLRLGRYPPQMRAADGVGDHQAQSDAGIDRKSTPLNSRQ